MIEDKELGLKIAENAEEAFWEDLKKKCEKDIRSSEQTIAIAKHIIELCKEKIKGETKYVG
jgi:hypothetical protein